MKKLLKHKEIILYIFWGIWATIINIVIFALLQLYTPSHYQLNNIIAWIITVLFAFITNKLYVFHAKHYSYINLLKQLITFISGRFSSLIIEIIILFIGISLLNENPLIIKIISNIVVTIINYFWAKIVSFKP